MILSGENSVPSILRNGTFPPSMNGSRNKVSYKCSFQGTGEKGIQDSNVFLKMRDTIRYYVLISINENLCFR